MAASIMHSRTLQRAALAAFLLLAGAALAACETTGGPAPQAAAAPMTHQEASLQCWMSTEKEASRMTLDKRADLVDACIERKMKGEPAAPATDTAAKPDAKPGAPAKPKS
jgi:hypothetical protein